MTLNPGAQSEREAEEYTVDKMKRWLKCRGKRDELVERGRDCIKRGDHHNFDPSIDNGKWFAAKVLNVSSDLQENAWQLELMSVYSFDRLACFSM